MRAVGSVAAAAATASAAAVGYTELVSHESDRAAAPAPATETAAIAAAASVVLTTFDSLPPTSRNRCATGDGRTISAKKLNQFMFRNAATPERKSSSSATCSKVLTTRRLRRMNQAHAAAST